MSTSKQNIKVNNNKFIVSWNVVLLNINQSIIDHEKVHLSLTIMSITDCTNQTDSL